MSTKNNKYSNINEMIEKMKKETNKNTDTKVENHESIDKKEEDTSNVIINVDTTNQENANNGIDTKVENHEDVDEKEEDNMSNQLSDDTDYAYSNINVYITKNGYRNKEGMLLDRLHNQNVNYTIDKDGNIQILKTSNLDEAKKIVKKLEAKGFKAVIAWN